MQKRKHTDANRPNHCRNTANDQPIGMLKKCALPYMGLSTVVIYSCDQEQAGTSLIMRWAQCRHTLHLVPRGAIKAINTTTDSTTIKWVGVPYYIKAIHTTTSPSPSLSTITITITTNHHNQPCTKMELMPREGHLKAILLL